MFCNIDIIRSKIKKTNQTFYLNMNTNEVLVAKFKHF